MNQLLFECRTGVAPVSNSKNKMETAADDLFCD